jgi:uncharacterized protein YqgV (UPF0045/DUF77 family)
MPHGKPFEIGNSLGKGRPKGSRNKSTAAALALLHEHSEALIRKCIAEALKGNMVAMRLCIERILPALQESAIKFKVGPTDTCAEVGKDQDSIFKEVSKGRIVPQQGAIVFNILEGKRRTIENQKLEDRVSALESGMADDDEPDAPNLITLDEHEDAA